MKGCLIVRSAARKVYLSPAGLVAPAFREISQKTISGRNWLRDLTFLAVILAATALLGVLNVYGKEIKDYFFPPVATVSPLDELLATAKSIAASGQHLCRDMDVDNNFTARDFYNRLLNTSVPAERETNVIVQQPSVPANGAGANQ